jgi:hypothetical protein
MNRVLFKAAAIVNIAAAALMYVACSGDDGKDGLPGAPGTSCNAVANAVAGGYDIVCGGVVAGNVKDGTQGIQGPPGTNVTGACTGTQVETGISITCNGEFVGIVTNGAPGPQGPQGPAGGTGPGGGGTDLCDVFPVKLNEAGTAFDQGIKIDCGGSDTTSIIICTDAVGDVSNGLFLNTNGDPGYCGDDGKVWRSGGNLRCGGGKVNLATQFCQRTLISTSVLTNGNFATNTTHGTNTVTPSVSTTGYPTTADDIRNPESAYNSLEGHASVQSVVLPLCGTTTASIGIWGPPPYTSGNPDVSAAGANGDANLQNLHASRVYNAKNWCARNLLVLNSDRDDALLTGNDRIDRFNPANPNYDTWGIIDSSNAFFYANNKGNQVPKQEALWWDYFRSTKTPYSRCPDATPIVSLDNYWCIARSPNCLIHSNIDNTCYVTQASADNVPAPGITITGASTTADWAWNNTFTGASGATAAPIGVQKYPLSRSLFSGTAAQIATAAEGNKWSKACAVLSANGFAYYAVNDPNLGVNPLGCSPIVPPATTPSTALSVENTFKCADSYTLSVNVPDFAGPTFDRPLYCRSCAERGGTYTAGGFICDKTLAPATVNTGVCGICNGQISEITETDCETYGDAHGNCIGTTDEDEDTKSACTTASGTWHPDAEWDAGTWNPVTAVCLNPQRP